MSISNSEDSLIIVSRIVDKLEEKGEVSLDKLLLALYPHVLRLSETRIRKKTKLTNELCGLSYEGAKVESFFWTLGLLSLEYVLGIFNKKAKEGHCHNHGTPCKKGTEFHRELLEYCKETFTKIIESNN